MWTAVHTLSLPTSAPKVDSKERPSLKRKKLSGMKMWPCVHIFWMIRVRSSGVRKASSHLCRILHRRLSTTSLDSKRNGREPCGHPTTGFPEVQTRSTWPRARIVSFTTIVAKLEASPEGKEWYSLQSVGSVFGV